jgi:ABC-2 type transport system ATP-binding protein
VIEISGLGKTYGRMAALTDLTFRVGEGEIFGFVGPNGAGKTTTIRILATLLPPTTGHARIDGIDVTRDVFEVRGRIGYMPDFFGVYDRLTSAEYLAFYAGCHGLPRSRRGRIVADLLELIGLSDRRDAQVNSLSRGMKQRLCLARALVHDPKVLLLDEPASGLDPRARVEMRELLKELKQMGKTIVISSHILPELAELCGTFGIIDQGRLVASGPLQAIMPAAGGARVRVRVDDNVEAAAEAAQQIKGVTSAKLDADGNLELGYDPVELEPGDLLAALMSKKVRVAAFTPVEEGLEDLFMRVTQPGPPT